LLVTWITKRSEERKHYKELVINAAIENWKQACEFAKASSSPELINPLDDFIIHMIKFSELIVDEKLDASNIEKKLAEINELTTKVNEYRHQQDRRLRSRT
jgi:hypothetical protein